jgi:hypothetical protein
VAFKCDVNVPFAARADQPTNLIFRTLAAYSASIARPARRRFPLLVIPGAAHLVGGAPNVHARVKQKRSSQPPTRSLARDDLLGPVALAKVSELRWR